MDTMSTLDYYNQNHEAYYADTVYADVSALYARVEPLLPVGAKIIDIGCGSGRDAKHFMESGYTVTAIDGSPELCKQAEKLLGIPVPCLLFQEIDFDKEFDAAWACSSLLHVPKAELPDVMRRICKALKPGGVFYASFKYGATERVSSGRFFADYTENDLPQLTGSDEELTLVEYWFSADVRKDRANEKWLNIIWKKESFYRKTS